MAPMLANVTFEEAAAVGASGGIGPAVAQLAVRQFGAVMTGVCGTSNVDDVRSLGASSVIEARSGPVVITVAWPGHPPRADSRHTLGRRR